MHQSLEVVFVAPKDAPHQTTQGGFPKSQLLNSVSTLNRGQWINLLIMRKIVQNAHRKHSVAAIAHVVGKNAPKHWCKLGSCPLDVVLWKAPLVLGNMATLRKLQHPLRRLPVPRSPMAPDLLTREPTPIVLEQELFLKNFKCARRRSRRTISFDFRTPSRKYQSNQHGPIDNIAKRIRWGAWHHH